ncbi:MAG: glycerol-3-phosphate dehydrogenase/oxidase [Nitrosomonadales bacterium]|nr:glycerol-3-phosphate dehydrogenase/oxidase [Nitrosomonadales bacterium]
MKRDFSKLSGHEFDLLVCGGGIYGAWTAYDAALRGLRVAIVEQGDWACGTSSASSKLIHGGLRYLETYDFKLVRKALKERRMLLDAAPHRVWPLRFGVPIYRDSRVGMLKMNAGLILYDLLAGLPGKDMAHRLFNRSAFAGRFSFLDDAMLKGGFTYGDAQTDDARLVLELIAGAMEAGAVCVNYCRMTDYIEAGGRVIGATVQDRIDGTSRSPFDKLRTNGEIEVRARQVVNTTGQWVSAMQQGRDWCRLSKGIHLVMPALPTDEALLLTAKSDGRVFFIIPWYGMTLLGTTDTDYRGDLDHVAVEPGEIEYLLAEANHYLKTNWTEADVVGSYAGVRVMKRSDAATPSAVSRDWELKTAGNGVHYSIGGKLTSAREDATAIVDTVCAQLGIAATCATGKRPFPWAPDENYAAWSDTTSARASRLGIDRECAKWLMRRHGKRADEALHMVETTPGLAARITPALPFIYADLLLCARDEMVVHLDDLLRRRMPLLILAKLSETELCRIAATVANTLGWDEAMADREISACIRQ